MARCRSFSDAARSLHLTQPSVSARIESLEGSLGTRLFHRRGTRVETTQAGSLYLEFVDRALHLLDEGRGAIAGGAGVTSTLRVGAPSSLVEFVLPKAIRAVSTRWPGVRLQVLTGTTEALIELLRTSGVDLIFARYRPDIPDARALVDFREPVLAVALPDHPVSRGASLRSYPCVLLDPRRGYWSVQSCFPDDPRLPVETAGLEVDNVTTAKSLVLEGRVVGLLPASTVVHEIRSGILVHLHRPEVADLHRTVIAVADAHPDRIEIATAFARAVGDTLAAIASTVADGEPVAHAGALARWRSG